MPTPTLEEYLEAIYKLSREAPARPSALAEAMSVSAPTVTATLRRLTDRGLIERPRGGVALTSEGERSALTILRRHRLAERFLVDTLGLPWDDVHEDACLLEHALTPRVERALETFLEEPRECPHGHPIPDADLKLPASETSERLLLAEAPVGTTLIVVDVREDDQVTLSEVWAAGLTPGTRVVVRDRTSTARIDVEVDGAPTKISADAAASVGVALADEVGEGLG